MANRYELNNSDGTTAIVVTGEGFDSNMQTFLKHTDSGEVFHQEDGNIKDLAKRLEALHDAGYRTI